MSEEVKETIERIIEEYIALKYLSLMSADTKEYFRVKEEIEIADKVLDNLQNPTKDEHHLENF